MKRCFVNRYYAEICRGNRAWQSNCITSKVMAVRAFLNRVTLRSTCQNHSRSLLLHLSLRSVFQVIVSTEFYVLLTVHLGIILVNNQLDAQFSFRICLFQISTRFEHSCAHHQENQLYQYDIWYMSLYVGDRQVCGFGLNWFGRIQFHPNLHVHVHRVTYTRCRIDTVDSPDDEHMSARNM